MAFVASFKNPLEIECVFLRCLTALEVKIEANDEGETGSYESYRRAISGREQKREKQDSGPVYCDHRVSLAADYAD